MNDKREISTYRWIALALVFAILLCLASGGLSVVWLRQKISHVAYENDQLSRQLLELDRKRDRLDAQIAKVHNPVYLIGRAKNGLRPTDDRAQVVWMSKLGQPIPPPEVKTARDERSPLTISFDLALLDPNEGSRTHP